MSYREEDLGEFNDSTVFFQPVHFNPKSVPNLTKHHNPEAVNLGIYDSIKLTQLLESKTGQLIEFVSLDQPSGNTFVTNEAVSLLERYSTDEVCFVVVVGNQESGKSFFCDKILNLSEIRGNHFCRKKGKGINIWSAPFQKDDLKIFILEISNCNINSHAFKILSTYALMIGSAFISIDGLNGGSKSSIYELDEAISNVMDKITSSRVEKGEKVRSNNQIFMPKIFFSLYRSENRRPVGNLRMIPFYAPEYLPDALEKGYNGKTQDLVHLPFLDTKCISEQYIRRVASIFKNLFSKLSEKRYKQLILNGNIVEKVIKYIQSYLNSKNELNVQELYLRVIQDLYQSAYNYCILTYHEQMQKQFEDEQPKSFDHLLSIFQRISYSTLQKFQEFNLDQTLYQHFYQKLQAHIDQKQQMIMDINAQKTEQTIFKLYDERQIGNITYYTSIISRIDKEYAHLDHGKANILGQINTEFYMKSKSSNNIDLKFMNEIEKLKQTIKQKQAELEEQLEEKERQRMQKSQLNKEQMHFMEQLQKLQNKSKQLNGQLTKTRNSSMIDPSKQKQEEKRLENSIVSNKNRIEELKGGSGKDQRITTIENKIQQILKKIAMQEKLLQELKETNQKEPENADKKPSKTTSSKKIQK